ncbi:Hypothetical predicted protein [Mytilus galloprovincialis]|uniref:Uncharacterized protein n=1 Tax=Mytilus galloprovincialis TaxID=29158 RepID=A0A8B6H5J2_MYTGA|nr:Hypothetical predicted protein [Mytilus galloprovincialis]
MQKLLFVLMFLLFTYQVEGWFFRRISTITIKNCFCKAVDADNTHKILHDFGSIQKCTRLFDCRCGHTAMVTCGDECDRRVTNWLKTNRWRCQFARTYYTASTCGAPTYGHHRKPC